MPGKKMRPRSRALLHTVPISFTAPIHLTFRQRRTLTLRGPVLLLSRYSKYSNDPSQASKLIVLTRTSRPVAIGKHQASVLGLKLSFSERETRDSFLQAADLAIERATGGIEKYAVLRELGRGASGVVYLVRRRADGERFAMKAIPKSEAFLTDSRLDSLISERAALMEAAQRRSSFIVRLVDAFETECHLCFVTELAEHADLKGVLNKMADGAMSESVAKRLFAEMVLALEESHRMGYLFRDLKLGNLLLNGNGHVKLADFGLSKRLAVESDGSSLSGESSGEDDDEVFRLVGRTTTFVGTRRYMSPEHLHRVAKTERGYGAPADVWALGVSLYILLTGDYPFGQDVPSSNASALFDAIRYSELKFPSWIGEEAKSLLKGMLERDQLERMDLNEIKTHPWLKNVSLTQTRFDAENNILQEDVISELQQNGIITGGDLSDEDEISSENGSFESFVSSGSIGLDSKCRKGGLHNVELIGFGYMPLTIEA